MALSSEKLAQKRKALIERTSLALHKSEEEVRELLAIKRQQSIRLNTLITPAAASTNELQKIATITPVPWMQDGLFINDSLDTVRDSELVANGAIYIQNAASWIPVLALNPLPGETILDMCAAPGGKTSHIAQRANNQALITANDNSRPRLHKLQNNLKRLNATNIRFTLYDATQLSSYLQGELFDKILLDAPCSGEGMMTLDNNKAFESWSVAHIKRLQKMQKKLIVQAWRLLKPGGTLVYSTCTMAPEENEAVIDYLLRHNDNVRVDSLHDMGRHFENATSPVTLWNGKQFNNDVSHTLRLIPSSHVEAFFVAKLTKTSSPTGHFEA